VVREYGGAHGSGYVDSASVFDAEIAFAVF